MEYVTRIDKKTPNEIKKECMRIAKERGKNIFAIQDNNACMIGDNKTYGRDGPSASCSQNMVGGPWLNSVFKIS
jgi:hypothetical protein